MNLEQIAQTAKPISVEQIEKQEQIFKELLPVERAHIEAPMSSQEISRMKALLKIVPEAREIDMSFLSKKQLINGKEAPAFACFDPMRDDEFEMVYRSNGEKITSHGVAKFYSNLSKGFRWNVFIEGSLCALLGVAFMSFMRVFGDPASDLAFFILTPFISFLFGFGGVCHAQDNGDRRIIEVKAKLPKGFILPQKIRSLIQLLSPTGVVNYTYIVTDSCEWTRNERKMTRAELDPLLIANIGDHYFLLARFDMTMLENAVASEFTK